MPDWSYSTLSGPLLKRVHHDAGRRFVNGFFARLGWIPHGYRLVDLLGHMAPDRALAVDLPHGMRLASPLVLAPCIDPEGAAAAAFSRFGFGALIFGPVSRSAGRVVFTQSDDDSIIGTGGAALSLQQAGSIVDRTKSSRFFFAIDPFGDGNAIEALRELIGGLAERAAAIILSPQCYQQVGEEGGALLAVFAEACREHAVAGLLGVPLSVHPGELRQCADDCNEHGLGLFLSGAEDDGGWRWGGAAQRKAALAHTEALEGSELLVMVDGGIRSPREAKRLLDAGADVVAVGPGLVHTGPGLPKRINETVLFYRQAGEPEPDAESPVRRPWVWAAVLGVSMLVGALLAGWSALTHVLLPYDEAFLGRSAAEITAFNHRILHFMTHDRITLAGTMVSIGVLYTSLSVFAIRRGHRWAQHAVIASATAGFVSFFAFLGFGYLDPFHAFVTAVLLQFLIQVVVRPIGPWRPPRVCPRLDNDAVWRAGLWGQLSFVVHAGALILAGLTILTYGMSVVFVPQDISYLGSQVSDIEAFDPQLKALIAHDRATFGGMLVSGGVALLLTSMWSFRHGDRWLLWTLFVTIFCPYVMTLWIHWDIGYRDHFHLAPVYIGLGLLLAGMAASARYLSARGEQRS